VTIDQCNATFIVNTTGNTHSQNIYVVFT